MLGLPAASLAANVETSAETIRKTLSPGLIDSVHPPGTLEASLPHHEFSIPSYSVIT